MSRIKIVVDYAEAPSYNSTGQPEHCEYDFEYPGTITEFQKLFYYAHNQTLIPNKWLGVPMIKYPTDLQIYQEMLFELRPDVIIETGTCYGGSALFFATICDALQHGEVLTIDVGQPQPETRVAHPRITYLVGSSTDERMLERVRSAVDGKKTWVILDSLHTKDHVLREMELYGPLVSLGSYMIVEDGNVNGHPVRPDFGPGPFEAIKAYLATHPEFEQDRGKERLMLTAAPGGFLKRI